MDFSKQLQNLARAANSNSRNNTKSSSEGESRRSGSYHSHQSHGNHNSRYHPYNNTNYRRRNPNNYQSDRKHFSSQADEDFYLPKVIQAIPKYQPIPTLPKKDKKRHVAILFLTIDDLPFEHLWRAFLNNYRKTNADDTIIESSSSTTTTTANIDEQTTHVDTSTKVTFESSTLMVSVLCHAKYPERVKSKWLQQRLLVSNPSIQNRNKKNIFNNRNNNDNNQRHTHQYQHQSHQGHHYDDFTDNDERKQSIRYHTRRPEWGSINITRAMIDLLDEALKIGTTRDRSTANMTNSEERYSTTRYLSSNYHNGENMNTDDFNTSNTTSAIATGSSSSSSSSEKIPTIDRFIFASESCVPVVTLKEFETALFGHDDNSQSSESNQTGQSQITEEIKQESQEPPHQSHPHYNGAIANKSWLKAYNQPNNGYARQLQWDAVKKAIPQHCIYKADQWIALTRHHAWPLVSLIDEAIQSVQQTFPRHDSYSNFKVALWQCFSSVKASDEMYFPTTMALLGMFQSDNIGQCDENNNVKDTVVNDSIALSRVTYCDWSENARNPASFVINRQQDSHFKELKRRIRMAREEGCLFARKFIPGSNSSIPDTINVEEWIQILFEMIHC